jgi:hypothetical protein
MAFLDNSGDIILDAVLTDVGRQRLSQGNFAIGKFALGDDEIQYNLYDKNHPSGSAYYDLQILQTPCETAHTKASNIQYGLISLTSQNVLYIPDLALNQLTNKSILKLNKIIHLAVNTTTEKKLTSAAASAVDPSYVLLANTRAPARSIIVESGLNTTDIKGTAANRSTYLQAVNMMDSRYIVSIDTRFFNGVLGTGGTANFTNNAQGKFNINFGALATVSATRPSEVMLNYVDSSVNGAPNTIYYYANAESEDTDKSAIAGPRGTVMSMNLSVPDVMQSTGTTRAEEWSKYGKLAQTAIDGKSQKYDIIDTMVMIRGASTGRSIQVPVRLLRYVSG